MMASSRGRDRSSPRDGSGFGRIGCLLHQAEEHAIMNRAETEHGSYASARNRKLLAAWAAKAGENEYAEPALNPCQTTAFEFFTDDEPLTKRRHLPVHAAYAGKRSGRRSFNASSRVRVFMSMRSPRAAIAARSASGFSMTVMFSCSPATPPPSATRSAAA